MMYNVSNNAWYLPTETHDNIDIVVTNNQKYNLAISNHLLLLKTWYDEIRIFYQSNTQIILVRLKEKWNFLNEDLGLATNWSTLKEILEQVFYFDEYHDGIDVAIIQNTHGYCNIINKNGELLLDKWYYHISSFYNGFSIVWDDNDKVNLLNHQLEFISKDWFDGVKSNNDKFSLFYQVFKNEKFNLIKDDGTLWSEVWFDYIEQFFNDNFGFAVVHLNGKIAIVNKDGNLQTEFFDAFLSYPGDNNSQEFQNFFDLYKKDGHDIMKHIVVRNEEKYNILTQDGNFLSKKWYKKLPNGISFYNLYEVIQDDGKFNFLDNFGEIIFEEGLDETISYPCGEILVRKKDKWNLLMSGGLLSDTWFNNVTTLHYFKIDKSIAKNQNLNYSDIAGSLVEKDGLYNIISITGDEFFSRFIPYIEVTKNTYNELPEEILEFLSKIPNNKLKHDIKDKDKNLHCQIEYISKY